MAASPHISSLYVARASPRRCGGMHAPEVRADVVYPYDKRAIEPDVLQHIGVSHHSVLGGVRSRKTVRYAG